MTETIERTIKKRHKSAGSKKGRQSVAHKGRYLRQFDRTAKNKEKARNRHIKEHPNDLMAKKLIKDLK